MKCQRGILLEPHDERGDDHGEVCDHQRIHRAGDFVHGLASDSHKGYVRQSAFVSTME